MAVSLLGGAASLISEHSAFAQTGATVGNLRGIIRDKGEAAVGATVVATSPALQGEQVVIADDTGQYFIQSLPAGTYTLTVYYNDRTFSRGNVVIEVGKEAVVNVTVDTSTPPPNGKGGEVIIIHGGAPIIDQGSTKTGVTFTEDYTRNIPVGRTFGAVMGAAGGAQQDVYGTSLSGATSVENTYIVEGINTTDTAFGGISSNLPNEFVSETEVITGGYNAEYGRATGGIINVVTKSGSNEFHGSVFAYWKPGALVSDADTVPREGSSIGTKTDLNYNYDVGAEVGGPIIKDKLWFHIGFNPNVSKDTVTRLVQSQVDENQDGVPDQDANGFNTFKNVSQSKIPENFKTYFFTAKINGAIDQNNQFQISAFGNPETVDDVYGVTANPSQTRWNDDQGAYDVSAKWTSKLNEGKTQIDAVVGFHRGYEHQAPYNGAENVEGIIYTARAARSLYDFQDLEGGDSRIGACNDTAANDPYPMIQNCPVLGYREQGIPYLEHRTNDRTSAALSITQRVKAAGYHTFKAGADVELSTYDAIHSYTGGDYWTRGSTGSWQERRFMDIERNLTETEINDPTFANSIDSSEAICAGGRALCKETDAIHADTSNRSIGAYLQDSWQIFPNFTLNLGVRYEQQVGYAAKDLQGTLTPDNEVVPDRAYTFNGNWAPRLGFVYDPTKEGKSKIFGHWGRFYENVPMDLNVRAFGGEIIDFQLANANHIAMGQPGYDANCYRDHSDGAANILSGLSSCTDRVDQGLSGEGVEFVTPGTKAQYTDELILGAEYELLNDFKMGVNYIHRTLPNVVEDISPDGGATYIITNPGQDFTSQANDLHNTAMQTLASGGCSSFTDTSAGCDSGKLALANTQENRSTVMKNIKNFDKPSRNYDAVQLTATQRPTKQSLVIATYTYSVEKGNYPGLFSTETGQLDPNITSEYDLPDLMANRYGKLGLDRPHNFKLDAFYVFDLKQIGLLTVGGSARAQSGIPHNILGASPHPGYGTGESYVLPRGTSERSPVSSQLDIHLSYGHKLNKTTTVEGFVNVFNLFDQQTQLNQDENYTYDAVNPIVGGDKNDLMHAKTLDIDGGTGAEMNKSPVPNKNFGHTGSSNGGIDIQQPRNIQFGVRLTF
ncbi:MAG TPA: carboxypeptidase regulatory-like domain-containing protein [Kofleriaceae bacterium]